ncbi:acetate--CoA ligase [Brevibacterium luteolum]|uniref:acetate--CoA ligase n=1 Tax=Brevibacterium luteolum TaxID=199591 RepID=UPI0021B07606|nr:acetate--CoA ligase [Brevibacterium luteolum]MCT1874028.1 acetate--CoA ligase [Brevibacterium luteolum]MCT1891778.1 acetate--CoA ligase [Brevibacterium luteolum]MCT1893230.1 acetate--CoA ligase [Brevibacterium luteolum]MCT1925204.1 acetate--CoA ligase [Brevibacterium luteolum]
MTDQSQQHADQTFPPPEEFKRNANVTADEYDRAAADPLAFWAEKSRELLDWETDFSETLDWSDPPFAKWFVGGRLNVAYNCLDRHVEAGNGDRVAIHFEGEPGDSRTYTYAELTAEVCKAANMLTGLGVKSGDRVAIYMPMVPEATIAMLACARLGAAHSVVFGGFSSDALHSRIMDAEAEVVITADGGYRRGKPSSLKPAVDEALSKGDTPVKHVVVVKRAKNDIEMVSGRDQYWHDLMDQQSDAHTPEFFDSEHPLFILYTSGTTGKPKGILHTSGGYLTQVLYSMQASFDIKPETDVFWCTADVGWITGHSYVAYGPLAAGATQVIYEGTPDSPHRGRWWEVVEKYKVSIFYAAPTAIRACMKWGREHAQKFDLSSLRLLGSVGEPINPEAWLWYHEVIGGGRCPIVDTWWQTETGAHMIVPLPGAVDLKPGSAQRPLPGISAQVVDDAGHPCEANAAGFLTITEPWPAMLRGIYKDPERFKETYWSQVEGQYFAGDGARFDSDGDIWFLGRIDDVMNVSGHRLSTAEIESALVSHSDVAESAVVGAADETSGQAVIAFVVLRGKATEDEHTAEALQNHVRREIGPIAKPKQVFIVEELPKTRSGKIMRRLLKDVAENRGIGNTTTLADASVMDVIASRVAEG